jgi:hypothetical protein
MELAGRIDGHEYTTIDRDESIHSAQALLFRGREHHIPCAFRVSEYCNLLTSWYGDTGGWYSVSRPSLFPLP